MKKALIVALMVVFGIIVACASMVGLPGEARADGQITFTDPSLEGAIRDALGISETEPISGEMALTLTSLDASSHGIENLDGLENFPNLIELNLGNNRIGNADVLGRLTNLQWLDLGNNSITDIRPLGKLRGLQWLNLRDNPIGDITPLSKLKNLKWLGLMGALISEIASDPNSPWLSGGGEGTLLDIWQSFSGSFTNLRDQNNLPPQPYWEGGNFLDNTGTLNEFWQTRLDLWNQTLGDIRSLAGDANSPWADFRSNFKGKIFNLAENRKNGSETRDIMTNESTPRLTTAGWADSSSYPHWGDYYNLIPWNDYYNNRPWTDYYSNTPWANLYSNSPWASIYNNLPWVYFYNNPPWDNFSSGLSWNNFEPPWANYYGDRPWNNYVPYWANFEPRWLKFYGDLRNIQPGGGNLARYFESYVRSLSYNSGGTTFPLYQPGEFFRKSLGR